MPTNTSEDDPMFQKKTDSLTTGDLWVYVHSGDPHLICFEFEYEGDDTQFGELNVAQARELRDWLVRHVP